MNVLILMPLAEQKGGAEQLLLELLKHHSDDDVTYSVVFFEDGPMREIAEGYGVPTAIIETGRLRDIASYLRAVWKLVRHVKQEQVDLVFSWMSKAHLYAAPAAALAGVRVAWYQHGIPDRHGWMDRLITMLQADKVLACSHAAANAQRRLWPHRETHVVYPCVDLCRFDPERLPTPEEARRRLGLPSEGPLIGLVGRLQRWKGQHLLVEALPMIQEAHPTSHVVLVGGEHALEPEYASILRDRIDELKLAEHVTLAGYQTDVPLWMQAMDVVVHASNQEPFGMVIIEAMALGKPVVATGAAGPAEIINDDHDGLLYSCGSATELATHVAELLPKSEYRAIARAARRRAGSFAAPEYARRFAEAVGAPVS